MQETVVLHESYVDMKYVHEYGMFHIKWNGNVSLKEYKHVFNTGFDFIHSNNIPFNIYLSDIRNQRVATPEIRGWLEAHAIPEAMKKGLKLGIVIFDGTVFKKYFLNLIMFTFQRYRVPFKFVNSYEEAIDFIEKFEVVESE